MIQLFGVKFLEKLKKDNELAAKREMEVQKAQEMGQSAYAMRLQLGGMMHTKCGLACCDPLVESGHDTTTNGTHNLEESKDPE